MALPFFVVVCRRLHGSFRLEGAEAGLYAVQFGLIDLGRSPDRGRLPEHPGVSCLFL
jgi:hypothetical protein